MNNGNLKKLSSSEARKNGKKGGIMSGEKRRKRKIMKEHLLMLLEHGNTQENIITALIEKAQSGDVRAFEVIRDTIGEKPTDKHENKISGCTEFQELYEAICKEKDYVR